ncbi:FRG domain-containing protein [Kocuria palustris]|jgi:hypothetical protein|uniref:FRG domain-containing protein n=1 Tax=Kocuria palustris TaxID=71999 RepID=UPI0019D2E270|nr:FRG domain-containing protein [Kocuria palustris]MBN6752992.1 FRG domain-containing protein [Kocuria palustris]MBN6757987.1 FRG domain-containing protein [Kocuria palustris]MBN6763015.1 FRG domain-containing protein [Kocuria palustris]MBN6782444.1 FRG domain-containing protein [Kocuria palustris]MBN6799414.1 FRG domain-containing protein [Kocuria palustris]
MEQNSEMSENTSRSSPYQLNISELDRLISTNSNAYQNIIEDLALSTMPITKIPSISDAIDRVLRASRISIGSDLEKTITNSFRAISSGVISKNLIDAAALNYSRYQPPSAKNKTAYSPEMQSPSDYFSPWEGVINDFSDLQNVISRIFDHHPSSTFLWRGQQDAAWALHSSLFRKVLDAKGVRRPNESHRASEPFPTEQDLIEVEERILSHIRSDWRFEDTSALSTFARLQHFGAPTRLLDVSRNPLIAAWFAVERHVDSTVDEGDSRLFALAATRVPESDTDQQSGHAMQVSRIDLETASSYVPFWHINSRLNEDVNAGFGEWGTGRIRRFWIPPQYETRISAQNAAFILDGVPLDVTELNKYFKMGRGRSGVWSLADRLAATSIGARFSLPGQGAGKQISRTLPPSYTFRITGDAKKSIRKELEERFAYTKSTIYPDIQGAAQAIGNIPDIFSI